MNGDRILRRHVLVGSSAAVFGALLTQPDAHAAGVSRQEATNHAAADTVVIARPRREA